MADVIKLGPKLAVENKDEPEPNEVNKDVVEQLEELLKEAKEGKLISLAFVSIDDDYEATTGYADGRGCGHYLISGSVILTSRMVARLTGDDE